jgi:hypothetical protein
MYFPILSWVAFFILHMCSSHRWQCSHSSPPLHPVLWKKTHGRHSPEKWFFEPTLVAVLFRTLSLSFSSSSRSSRSVVRNSIAGCTAGSYCGLCHYCPVIHPKVPGQGGPNTQRAAPTSQSAIEFLPTPREDRDELEKLNDNVRNNTATNVGSKNHFSGECRPCVFFHKTGCNGGDECEHCHLCDEHICKMKKATQLKIGKYIRKLPSMINLSLFL